MTSDDQADQEALDALTERLGDQAVWAQPPPELEEQIVAAIAHERDRRRRRPTRYVVAGAAASVLLAAGLAVGLAVTRDNDAVEFTAALSGTELAPGASGKVTLTRTSSGWKIELHADGLPRRGDGEYYEAWLKNSAGVLVPVGTFNEFGEVTLWSGVSPLTHPDFTVTRQVADGNPASTGQVVLKGSTKRSD